MRRIVCIIVGVAVVFTSVLSVRAQVIGNADKEVRTIADPILDNILEGMKTDDYAKYSRDFDDIMKEALPKEKFLAVNQQIRNQIGDYKSREYLGFLNKSGMTIVLWKGTFDGAEGDVLIKLVVSKREDKCLVIGLWFE